MRTSRSSSSSCSGTAPHSSGCCSRAHARLVWHEPPLGPLRGRGMTRAAVRYVPVSFFAVVFALPIFWVLVTSLKRQSEFGSSLFPTQLEWPNYQLAVVLADFMHFALNSLVLSGSYATIVVIVSALVGYGFARHRGPGRNQLFGLVLALLIVPPI